MGDQIHWQELYDALSGQYQQLETNMQECQKTLARTEMTVAESVRKKLLDKICDFGDNLFHLAQSVEQKGHEDALKKGVWLIIQHYVELLKSEKVIAVKSTTGEKFNPQFHEAVNMLPSADVAEGHIIKELRKGYVFNGAMLRPARVTVSSGKPTA
jgi:molecular chaperone GrpE